jgi:hypothetical protein
VEAPLYSAAILARIPLFSFDRRSWSKVMGTFVKGILSRPELSAKAAGWLLRKAWQARSDLWATRGRVSKLSFVIHNFMDACGLERDRIDACAFMAMTQCGPISMCLHNAKRDAFILAPIRLRTSDGEPFWDPMSGQVAESFASPSDPKRNPAKERSGRAATEAAAVVC